MVKRNISDRSIGFVEMSKNPSVYKYSKSVVKPRVSVQRVKSLGGHFACLCREFDIYEVKKKWYLVTKIVLNYCKKKMF